MEILGRLPLTSLRIGVLPGRVMVVAKIIHVAFAAAGAYAAFAYTFCLN
jgi:hypothetical protein